jgi:hypothetical protein
LHVSSSPNTWTPLFFYVYASKNLDSFFKCLALSGHGTCFISQTPPVSTCLATLVAFISLNSKTLVGARALRTLWSPPGAFSFLLFFIY